MVIEPIDHIVDDRPVSAVLDKSLSEVKVDCFGREPFIYATLSYPGVPP